MLACPADGAGLERIQTDDGMTWACRSCGGRAVAMPVLRRLLPKDDANQIWATATEDGVSSARRCPVCEQPMRAGSHRAAGPLEVCRRCQFVWFDGGELERLPHVHRPAERKLPEDALERLARIDAERIRDEWERKYPQGELPPGAWEVIPGALGLPFQEDEPPLARVPFATWVLTLLIVCMSAWGFIDPDIRHSWALSPADPLRHGGADLVVSFFVHGGLFHVISNVWFLMTFGDDVEAFLGHANFGLLLGVSAFAGAVAHVFLAPDGAALVGAGAGVSGVVVFYGLRFPQARLRYFRFYRWLTMPASLAAGFWVFSQFIGARDQISGGSDVSYVAHVAGAAAGLWFWFLWRRDPA